MSLIIFSYQGDGILIGYKCYLRQKKINQIFAPIDNEQEAISYVPYLTRTSPKYHISKKPRYRVYSSRFPPTSAKRITGGFQELLHDKKRFLGVDLIQITIRCSRSQKQDKSHCFRQLNCSKILKKTLFVWTKLNMLRTTLHPM